MLADWADIRSFLSDYDVTAVSAFPDCVAVFAEYQILCYVVKEFSVTFFVTFFNGCDHFEKQWLAGRQ